MLCGSGSTAPRRTRCPARSATRLGELSPPVAVAGIVAWTGTEPAFFDPFTAFPLAAVRLHGRNARKWWRHDHAEERYDYHYSAAELQPFRDTADAAARLVKRLYLYMNNHFAAKSVANAATLKHHLGLDVTGAWRGEMVAHYPELDGVVRTDSAATPALLPIGEPSTRA